MMILLICGSIRSGSTNAAALATVAQLAISAGVHTVVYNGLAELPAFNPDDDHDPLPAPVAHLRQQLGTADAVLFSTPEYAGALPGSFKNLLDWSVGGGEIYQKPVGWLNVSSVASPTGGADAHESLHKVLGYVGAKIIESACVRVPMSRADVGPDAVVSNPVVRDQLQKALTALTKLIGEQYPTAN